MTLPSRDPWRLFNELGSLFESRNTDSDNVSACDWVPVVDIKENDTRFTIHADVPGVKPENIDVHMENGMLSISGKREEEKKEETDTYKRVERSRGTFLRRFTLPDSADPEKIDAKCENGVLDITIAKRNNGQPRKIKVKS